MNLWYGGQRERAATRAFRGGVVEPARSEAVLCAWLTIVIALVCTLERMRPELSAPHPDRGYKASLLGQSRVRREDLHADTVAPALPRSQPRLASERARNHASERAGELKLDLPIAPRVY